MNFIILRISIRPESYKNNLCETSNTDTNSPMNLFCSGKQKYTYILRVRERVISQLLCRGNLSNFSALSDLNFSLKKKFSRQ